MGTETVNSHFHNNSARSGGAVVTHNGWSLVEGCNFTNNRATHYDGGAMELQQDGILIRSSHFQGNYAN
ncbi:hypothetical protein SARC_17654, partial [Sphaeroforma arctica JP610]